MKVPQKNSVPITEKLCERYADIISRYVCRKATLALARFLAAGRYGNIPRCCLLISCGGLLQPTHMCFLGPDAERFLSNIEAEVLFLGTSGVRGSLGLTTSSPLQLNIKQAMIRAARKRVALFDLSKFKAARLFMFSDFSNIDTIITTRPARDSIEEAYFAEIERKNVEIIYADMPDNT